MAAIRYTVILKSGERLFKICKIWFGKDGSYYITSPYHRMNRAYLIKTTINYTNNQQTNFDAIDSGLLDDDRRRLKLSHHPDGFVQFSGEGILSGRNPDGSIRGMGIMSWPLDKPVLGPAFVLTIRDVEGFEEITQIPRNPIILDVPEFTEASSLGITVIEGFYYPSQTKSGISSLNGEDVMLMYHLIEGMIPLKIMLPSDDCLMDSFLGVRCFTLVKTSVGAIDFVLTGPTGNVRHNIQGYRLADAIFCIFPPINYVVLRQFNFLAEE